MKRSNISKINLEKVIDETNFQNWKFTGSANEVFRSPDDKKVLIEVSLDEFLRYIDLKIVSYGLVKWGKDILNAKVTGDDIQSVYIVAEIDESGYKPIKGYATYDEAMMSML